MQDSFFIRMDKKHVKVNYKDIVFVEASKNYIRIVTRNKAFMVLLSMRQMEEILPSALFCRVHRSYIVSFSHITAFDSSCVYIDEKTIPVGEQYKSALPKKVIVVQSDVRKHPAISVAPYRIMETAN